MLASLRPALTRGDRLAVADSVVWLRVLTQLIVALIGVGTLLGLIAAARGVLASGHAFHHEGWMLFSILRVRDGAPLYTDYQTYPFNLALYTPLYYEVVGILARLLDFDVDTTVTLARSLSGLAAVASAVLLVAIGRQCGLSLLGAAAAAGLFASSYIVHPWLYSARPDALALACCLAGLWIGLRWTTAHGALGAGLLLALAFHTKQSHLAAAAALMLGALQGRAWGRAFALATTWSIGVGMGLILEQATTDGLFAANTMTPNVLPMRLELVFKQVGLLLTLGSPLLLLAAIGWPGLGPAPRSLVVMRWYGLLATGAGLFATAKIGASYNQFLEVAVVLALFGARGVERLLTMARQSRYPNAVRPHRIPPLAVVLLASWIVAASILPAATLLDHIIHAPDDATLVRAIEQTPGDVLTERDSLAVVRAGKTPVFADSFGLTLLARG